jgi:hypothetical protein
MKKYIKEYKSGCPRYEVITIDNNIMTQEFLFIDTKAVWKTWTDNIINDLHWKEVKDHIKWIKELGYKELKNYRDNLTWINTNTNKSFKQYEF